MYAIFTIYFTYIIAFYIIVSRVKYFKGEMFVERLVGTVSRGLRAPIIKEGDDVAAIVLETVINASELGELVIQDRDIIAVTESVVARAQGNYATVDDIAADVSSKFGDEPFGVVFPILSRNRFSVLLRGISKGAKKIYLMLSYPSDEVGNHLVDMDTVDVKGVNPWTDVLTEVEFRDYFGYNTHPFTGVDYIEIYKSIMEEMGIDYEIIFSNNPLTILEYTKNAIACDIHTRFRTKSLLRKYGGQKIFGLDDVLSVPRNGNGYNQEYGLLGSNKSSEDRIKLFPRDGQPIVEKIQKEIKEKTGKLVEVMVYGDGAFKDPVGKIWELADPVVSPAYTKGLEGTPSEIKLKYLADNQYNHLKGDELKKAISDHIRNKEDSLIGNMASQGTTPRRLTDLIGSLADLTSGSGDKGTPIIYIQGYFDSYIK